MKFNLLKFLVLTLIVCTQLQASAQSTMEESFHANGSIRVVVAVAIIVMTGLLFFVLRMDRRVKKLEEKQRSEN